MIRLNDKYNSRVNENDINWYGVEEKEGVYISIDICGDYEHLFYETKEARDKDIELLDQLFEVKDIKEQVEIAKLKKEVASHDMGIPSERARDYISNLNTCAPVKKEEYLTWKDVKRIATKIKAELPNGYIRMIYYDEECFSISIMSNLADIKEAIIYDEDLFNALMLKKVE
jgi:hypothetical protein